MHSEKRTLPLLRSGRIRLGGGQNGARLGSKRHFAAGGDFDGNDRADLAVSGPGWPEGGIYASAVRVAGGPALRQLLPRP